MIETDTGEFGDFSAALTAQANQVQADRRLLVEFHEEEIEDQVASEAEGRPIFRTVEMCTIRVPGDKDNVVKGEVARMRPDPRKRFGALYKEWKAQGGTNQIHGTLLRECGGLMSRARAREYEAFHVYTVEQLAELSDANCQNVRGALADRVKAKDWLALAADRKPLAEARAENAKLRSELEVVKESVEKLTKLLEERTEPAASSPKKGR